MKIFKPLNHFMWYTAASSLMLGATATAQDHVQNDFLRTPISARHEPQSSTASRQIRKSVNIDNLEIGAALKVIAEKFSMSLGWSRSLTELTGTRVSLKASSITAQEALDRIFSKLAATAYVSEDGRTIVVESVKPPGKDSVSPSQGKGIVKARVVDSATGAGVKGVTLSFDKISISAVTDEKGEVEIVNAPVGDYTYTFRMLGYKTVSGKIAVERGKTIVLNVRLVTAASSLQEVITTATGQARRVEIAHDIAKIDAEKIMERAPIRNVTDLIAAAQIPGVLIQSQSGDPGSPSRIRIRGLGSISESNDPVIILDGIWIDATPGTPSKLDDIDPSSIETIEVVRGPSAATLYGQDAANGVIVITTKKGKAGPTRWTFSYNRDGGKVYGKQPLVYYGIGTRPGVPGPVRCSIAAVLDYHCVQDSVIVIDPNHKLLAREGVESNNRLVVQMDGGAPNITYSITASTGNTIGVRRISPIDDIRQRIVGYTLEDRFKRPSEMSRSSLTSNTVFSPRNNLTVGMTLTGSQSSLKDNSVDNSWYLTGRLGAGGGRNREVYALDSMLRPLVSHTLNTIENPVNTMKGTIATSIQYRPRGTYVVNANLGAEKNSSNHSQYIRKTLCTIESSCRDTTGERQERLDNKSLYTVRLNATTGLNLGRLGRILDLRPSIGGDYRLVNQHSLDIRKINTPVGDRSIHAGELRSSINNLTENATAGWYINSMVGVWNRIYFDIGVRQDIGSAIASSSDAIYPKIGGSWLVSDESFWRDNSIVSSLRLRSAIGHSAVQPDVSDVNGKYLNNTRYLDGKHVPTVSFSETGNYRLQPERAVEVELGFDLDLLGDRINLIGTYAHTENKNTLVVRTLPESFGTGLSTRKENVARVSNRNFELSAFTRAIDSRSALLILNYALTISDNKVARLGNGLTPFSGMGSRIAEGYPLAGVWTRRVLGYRDANDDGLLSPREIILSDSSIYIGWTHPRYRASYGASLTVRNQLVFDSRFAYQSRYVQSYQPSSGFGAESIDAPFADQASALIAGLFGRKPISDMRWNSASVTYHLPKSLLQKIGGRTVSISLKGSNLGLWTNYVGRDPAVNSELLNGEVTADDGQTSPRPRLFVLDFKFGL